MPMLTNLVKEHIVKQQLRKELQEQRKQEAIAATTQFTQAVITHLNSRVSQAYTNQKRLDGEAKKLQSHTAVMVKQANQWLQLADNFNTALKEIGDVENWASTIENDVQVITISLENAYRNNQEVR